MLCTMSWKAEGPTIYAQREFAAAGDLISYGPNNAELYRTT
jgi:hypothetical protein